MEYFRLFSNKLFQRLTLNYFTDKSGEKTDGAKHHINLYKYNSIKFCVLILAV